MNKLDFGKEEDKSEIELYLRNSSELKNKKLKFNSKIATLIAEFTEWWLKNSNNMHNLSNLTVWTSFSLYHYIIFTSYYL